MNKTIISIIIIAAVLIVGWIIMKNTNTDNTPQTNEIGLTQEQQAVLDQILATDKLTIETLEEGNGPRIKLGEAATMNYTGRLTNGTVFDSNVDPAFNHVEPFQFVIGAGNVIQGWDLGIIGMKEGEKRRLTISPDLAYGSADKGTIPPNSTLIFEVELVKIN